ncbi:hypothetical protein LRB11_03865 [Ectothiorhodospira haloalkaliphila]|nr:hypothetical protein [Ectothiorhodospira haloalkaliphila]MCG5524067.1 hypothetical protein [Ectothiorhodospira haloalkaliphila]
MNAMLSYLPDMKTSTAALGRRCGDGLLGLWSRVFHRNAQADESWLEKRDMAVITATLMRLSERQLSRIGMSRRTLALDVEDLAARAQRELQVSPVVLEVVKSGGSRRVIRHE